MTNKNSWYLRSAQGVTGPFPSGQIAQMVLLGRIKLDAQVSHDKEKWISIGKVDSLIPDVYKTADSDELSKERIEAAKRWADERREERRHDKREPQDNDQGRRVQETAEEREHREKRESAYKDLTHTKKLPVIQLGLFLIFIVIAVYFSFLYSPVKKTDSADCNAGPNPAINWKNCNKFGLVALKQNFSNSNLTSTNLAGANLVGSDLSRVTGNYVDLSRANLSYTVMVNAVLKGANFMGADLSNANMENADLQYADFTNSTITNVSFKNANLSFAIWIDGRKCNADSISVCK